MDELIGLKRLVSDLERISETKLGKSICKVILKNVEKSLLYYVEKGDAQIEDLFVMLVEEDDGKKKTR